jgi:undecaprenyl diphosphate synthase
MKHLAIIMDGNRRWAKKRSLQPWLGHRQGAEVIQKTIEFCLEKKISYLSLYTFSLENFNRSAQEQQYLFDLLIHEAPQQLGLFLKHGVKVCFIGERSLFPKHLLPTIRLLEENTQDCKNLQLNFLFCYGAQQEIISGVKKMIVDVKNGFLSEQDISEKTFSAYLWTATMPEPELIIRTGGAQRLSNFLLYQAAYSEFYFFDCLWPELEQTHLQKAFDSFTETQRNFGS